MRRFIVEAIVDVLLIVLTGWLLSLVRVPQPFPFGTGSAPMVAFAGGGPVPVLLLAAAVAITNRFVRPLIVAFTGRLVLATAGLFLVVVTWLVFRVAALLAPGEAYVIADPGWLWLLLGAAVFGLLSTLVDAVLGLNRPTLDIEGRGKFLWRVLDGLPTPRRSAIIENLRFQQVYDTIYRYGLDIFLGGTPIGRVRGWFQRVVLREADDLSGRTTPERIRLMLQALGPTYVKIGQMVASRGEALPPEWLTELQKLQSDAAPFPWEQAREILAKELGADPDTLFATFETEPFAAASTAQVHRATLPDGTLVAVKVQRPNIVAKTKADLGVMQELAKLLERRVDLARKLDVSGILAEFARGVLRELDYRNESYNARRIADNMAKFPRVHVPVVVGRLSGERVMTAEFVKGVKISNVEALDAAGIDRHELGEVFARALIKQVLVDGFFHGDPHPGNMLVDTETGRLIFLDFGLVGRLSREQRLDLIDLINGLQMTDSSAIADALEGLGKQSRDYDQRSFREAIDRIVRQYLVYGEGGTIGDALSAVMGATYDNGLRLDNDLTLAIKALVQAQETLTILDPRIEMGKAALEESRDAVLGQISYDAVRKTAVSTGLRVGKQVVRRLPTLEQAAYMWMDELGKGKLTVTIDTSDLGVQFQQLDETGRRLTVGLMVVGQLIGSAILAVIALQPAVADTLGPLAWIAVLAFFGVLAYSLVMVYRVGRPRQQPGQ
ncbi:MAG TPA: AarF/UbiB family protein [Candidatus Limnocylindrales bacterium]|nr:AarF/UbiB family protein [Candidatus Limnocylindrales bacterium]